MICTATIDPRLGFNPRSRVGSDRHICQRTGWICRFNPRSRVGSDNRGLMLMDKDTEVSIHAPAWGATEGLGS